MTPIKKVILYFNIWKFCVVLFNHKSLDKKKDNQSQTTAAKATTIASSLVEPSIQELATKPMMTTVPPRYIRPAVKGVMIWNSDNSSTEQLPVMTCRNCSPEMIQSMQEWVSFSCWIMQWAVCWKVKFGGLLFNLVAIYNSQIGGGAVCMNFFQFRVELQDFCPFLRL